MKRDNFDEAVCRAKYSQHAQIRYYVAEFFIITLIKGMQSDQLPVELIQKLGRWAVRTLPG